MTGLGVGAGLISSIPVIGSTIPLEQSLTPVDTAARKQLADIALIAARSKGASYADVRIGRYLNQFITTREKREQNLTAAQAASRRAMRSAHP